MALTTLNNAEMSFSADGTRAIVKGINSETGKEEAYSFSGLVLTEVAGAVAANKHPKASPFELDFKAVVKND